MMKIPKINGMKSLNFHLTHSRKSMASLFTDDHIFYGASHFHHMLRIEKKRAERSQRPFLLILFDISDLETGRCNGHAHEKLKKIIFSCSREIDIRGWYKYNKIIGAIYTEMVSVDEVAIDAIYRKVQKKITTILGAEVAKKIIMSMHPITPSHILPSLEQHLPDRTKEEDTRKESETFSQPFIYNEIAVY